MPAESSRITARLPGAKARIITSDAQRSVPDVNAACDRSRSRDESVTALAAAGGIAVVSQHRVDEHPVLLAGNARTERPARTRAAAHPSDMCSGSVISPVVTVLDPRRRLVAPHAGRSRFGMAIAAIIRMIATTISNSMSGSFFVFAFLPSDVFSPPSIFNPYRSE